MSPDKSKRKRKPGGQELLSPELAEKFLEHLGSGLWRHNAAELVGVHEETIKKWMSKGRAELEDASEQLETTGVMPKLGRYASFACRVLAVEARTESEMVGVVTRIARAKRNPELALKAATWWLERKRNLLYGRGAFRLEVNTNAPEDEDDVAEAVLDKLGGIETKLRAVNATAHE